MSIMVLQYCKSSPQKSRPLKSGHRRRGVWLAIEYSYKLGQKMNLNFSANYRLVFAETVTIKTGTRCLQPSRLLQPCIKQDVNKIEHSI